jgi:uncharacterized protein (TIGR02001 family)
MKAAHFLGTALLGATALFAPAPASAQQTIESLGLTVTTTPAAVTDYLFRGISQTRSRPAGQLTLDVEHSSGLYVGTFVSNANFAGTNIRQEVDGLFGYRFTLAEVKFDIGATYFGYPGYDRPAGGTDAAWWEVNLRASYEIEPLKFLGQVSYSPNFNFESGEAWYVEIGVDAKLDFDITASLRLGRQWVQHNANPPAGHGAFGAPDYNVFSFGFSREIAFGVVGALTFSTTSLDRSDCFGGQNICGTRLIAGLSRPF